MLGPAVHHGKDTTHKTLEITCVMRVRGPNNVGRAVQTDPTLLRYASAITEQKKCWVCWLKRLTGFKFCATTRNNMQQGVQTDETCNIRQFWELSVCLHKVLGTLRFKGGTLRTQRFLLAPRRLGRLARRKVCASATEIPY